MGLGLHAELEDVHGKSWHWDANARDPEDRPQNLSFRTQRGDGFAEGSVTLRRRIDRDYPDLALLTKLRFVADDGFIAYEGRISEFPRELGSDGHSIQVTAAGYMASARDRKFTEIYVDRDLSRWGTLSAQYRINNPTFGIHEARVQPDETTGVPVLFTGWEGQGTSKPWSPAVFDAGVGITIGSVYYAWKKHANVDSADTNYAWSVVLDDVDTFTSAQSTGNLRAAGPGTGTLTATSTDHRFALAQFNYAISSGFSQQFGIFWTTLAVYGSHGLDKQGTEDATNAKGFYVSDLIRNIAGRFCPQLDPSGVESTSYVVKHCAFHDPIEPYEAFQELNRLHLYELNVWEDGILYFHPPSDLDDWDWEVRTDDPGTEVRLQGDSVEDLANGIVVTYDDFWGKEHRITPDDEPQLLDSSEDNPANIWGIDRWTEPPGGKIRFPTTEDDAVQIGRAALGELSTPKSPGEIIVRGYIRDRRGNWQPTHKVRCGERIRIANHPNDRPRRIVDTDFTDDEQKTLRVSTDNATKRVEGLFDRIEAARKAANLA